MISCITGDPDDDDADEADDDDDPVDELDAEDPEDDEPFVPLELADELDDPSPEDDWPSLGLLVFSSKQPPMSVVNVANDRIRFMGLRKAIEPLRAGIVVPVELMLKRGWLTSTTRTSKSPK